MSGAALGEVQVSLFVAGAALGEVQVSLFVASAVLRSTVVLEEYFAVRSSHGVSFCSTQ